MQDLEYLDKTIKDTIKENEDIILEYSNEAILFEKRIDILFLKSFIASILLGIFWICLI